MPSNHVPDTRVVFFGTPEFAATSLEYLLERKFNVVGVVTTPDRPAGRGHKLRPSAVKEVAKAHKVPLLQPEKLKDESFLKKLSAWQGDIFVVVAFRMLPKEVWAMPPKGTFNLHASLLPAYRGAAPINRAIQNGEKVTGNTTFLLDEDIDTGNILLQHKMPITQGDNAGSLHDKLMHQGRELVALTIEGLSSGTLKKGQPQDPEKAKRAPKAPKIFKEDLQLHFSTTPADQVILNIRAMSPYPTAFGTLVGPDGKETNFKIFAAMRAGDTAKEGLQPGEISTDGKTFLHVGTPEGVVDLMEIQPPNKKRMTVNAYLNGATLPEGASFK